jgi:hypothetical protein
LKDKHKDNYDEFENEEDLSRYIMARAPSGLIPETRPLITKLFGDHVRLIRPKELAVIYDKNA